MSSNLPYLNKHVMGETHEAWISAQAQILEADHLALTVLIHLEEHLEARKTGLEQEGFATIQ